MPHARRATDAQIRMAYTKTRSCKKAAAILGLCHQSVHERLVKLGINRPVRVFTDAERARLARDYVTYRAAGKVSTLATELGRTIPYLSRQARALGLTDARHPKHWHSVWRHMSEADAAKVFDRFRHSRLTMGEFCKKNGYDDSGFARTMRGFFPDEWDAVIEAKAPRQTLYRLGRAFEYRVRDELRAKGYFVLRSPRSNSPIDLVAIKPGEVLMLQCKRGGYLPPSEWNEVLDLATSCGAVPLLAEAVRGKGAKYYRLTGRKDGTKRAQPCVPWP